MGHTIQRTASDVMWCRGTAYEELGFHYSDERNQHAVQRRLVRRLEGLGYKVALEPAVA